LKQPSDKEMEPVMLAMKAARQLCHQAHEATEAQRKATDALENELRALSVRLETNGLNHLIDRLLRLRELRNQMEVGSFGITVNRELDVIWGKIR